MSPFRLQSTLAFFVLACGLFASPFAFAVSPPAWKPYRRLPAATPIPASPPTISRPVAAQYQIPAPPSGLPVEALTDYELNQMSIAGCENACDTAMTFSQAHDDLMPGALMVDPVLAAASHETRFELLPDDVIWHSYFAGAKEPRMSGLMFRESNSNLSLFDVSLGGRTSVVRLGRQVNGRPLGWELQLEGAAMLRLNLDQDFDFDAVDFRFGLPLIYAPHEQLHWKFAYYHLSSHIGDEFLVRNPGFTRINFSRDVLVLGASFYPLPAWRWYAETGWAFYEDEGSDQWEFQFGLDYSQPGPTGTRGTPFAAINGHLREELNYGGNFVLQAGWLWRGQQERVLRTGLHYYNGKSSQFEFYNNFEQQLGAGLWYEY